MPRFREEKDLWGRSARRIYAIGAMFALAFGILLSRAIVFHMKDNQDLQRVAMRQYRTAVRQGSARGKILDASGRDMAIDVTAESIWANPREVRDAVVASEKLAKALGIDRSAMLERLSGRRKFVWIKRRVAEKEAQAVKGLGIEGIYSMKENSRSYPNGTVGASLLGAVGYDSEPLGGIELLYNEALATKLSSGDLRRDARGHLYLSPADTGEEPAPDDVHMTIDKTLQYIADKNLSNGVSAAKARAGQAVVVDIRTGAVLAISNVPTFNPNEYEKYPLSAWRNSAIVEPHEPGSTFKVIVVSAALDSGAVKATDVFDCEGGKIKIGDNVINDAHPHRKLTVADIIKVSSNIGAYKIESRLEPRRVYEVIRSFGFGGKTEIDLPGEAAGLLQSYSRWSPIQFATIAFGQGIAATPLQMAMAFAAIANGGKLMKPYIVSRITDDKGGLKYEARPEVVGQPIRPETALVVTSLLKRVVEEGGTGTLAASYEYGIAGKTGTAQKVDPRTGAYAKGRYYSSFVGFAPADAPRIAVFVGLDEPRGAYYGGQVAAPVFRNIVEETLHYLKVPSDGKSASQPSEDISLPPPAVADMPIVASSSADIEVESDGEGAWVIPDFTGLTMREVLAKSRGAEIDWSFAGSGFAVAQDPAPGSSVRAGQRCAVEFRPMM